MLSACAESSLSQKGVNSDEDKEEATIQGSKVRMQSHVSTAIIYCHQPPRCIREFSSTLYVGMVQVALLSLNIVIGEKSRDVQL